MQADQELDITDQTCPMTFVRAKLAVEGMRQGETLKVLMRGEEPKRNVTRALEDHGHEVLALNDQGGGLWELWVKVA